MLESKKILITGASRGIGRAIALACARERAAVGISYRDSEDQAKSLQKEIASRYETEAMLLPFDVRDPVAAGKAVDFFSGESDRIDGLVNCSRYYFVVRAEDGAGNVDENTAEMEGIPADTFCFFPEAPLPGQQELAIVEAERVGDSFRVDILCNGFVAAYGAAFRLSFDPQVIAFESMEAGAALEGSGVVLRMLATEKPAGTLIAGISRSATMEGAEITDVATLCTLTFDIVGTGVTGVSFIEDKSSVLDAGLQREDASWHGGTLSVIHD